MNCPICTEKFNEGNHSPKLLPCGHTFCINCIPQFQTNETLNCPIHGYSFYINIEELKTNYIILSTIEPSQCVLKCCNGHELSDLIQGPEMKCEKCFEFSQDYLQCPSCVYVVCKNCYHWITSSKSINFAGLLCYKGHVLRKTENIQQFYNFIRKNRPNYFLCDGCIDKKRGTSAHCRECRFDYCEECLFQYEKIYQNIEDTKCGKILKNTWFGKNEVCQSQLAWRFSYKEFKCNECRKKFNKSGAFLCKNCEVAYCIKCVYSRIFLRAG